jgi:outer membrane protein assembly factor BamB
LYALTARDLVALNPDGTIRWRSGNGACSPRAHPVLDQDENIYVPLGDFIVSFTPDGKERWRVPLAHPMTLILGDHRRLYVPTSDNKLYAIDEQ